MRKICFSRLRRCCEALDRSINRLGLGQTVDLVFGDPAFGTEHVQPFETLHHIAFFADLAANAETGMLRHCFTSRGYMVKNCKNFNSSKWTSI